MIDLIAEARCIHIDGIPKWWNLFLLNQLTIVTIRSSKIVKCKNVLNPSLAQQAHPYATSNSELRGVACLAGSAFLKLRRN